MLATVVAGSIVLAAALLVPFEGLLVTTNALTLGVFVLVDLALWRIQRKAPGTRSTFVAPRWVPLLGALVALTLMLGEFLLLMPSCPLSATWPVQAPSAGHFSAEP